MTLTYKAVIATFPGREAYLAESVESLREQGVEPVVVCDTRWGPPKWNEAIDTCETDLLFLPHDDDVYGPDFIREMVAYMEAHPEAAACFCYDRSIDGEGRRLPKPGTALPIPPQGYYDFKTVLNGMISSFGNFLRCETVCLRPSLLGDMRFPLDAGCGKAIDTAFWFLILSRQKIGIVNKQLVYYREHAGQDTEGQRATSVEDHWKAIDYAIALRPDDLEWDRHIIVEQMRHVNTLRKEMERVKEKKDSAKVRLVVVHEPPDNAGTGVVAAHRVRQTNKREGEIAYYVFPDPNSTAIQEGYFRGCPVIGCPPALFPNVVSRWNPELVEFHHTLVWGDGILGVETNARKEVYLHDRWMWSEHPHTATSRRSVDGKTLEGSVFFANSPFLQAEAQEALGCEVGLFDPFVPLPHGPMAFRKRVGFFGGFSTTKGVHILLQAARKLPDVLFVCFTQPPDAMLEGRRIHGHPNVVVMGAYARADLHLLVHLVDVVAVPSTFESHGLVKREIESLGVPVISTKTGGMGGDIPPDSVQALVEAINGGGTPCGRCGEIIDGRSRFFSILMFPDYEDQPICTSCANSMRGFNA